MWSSRFGSKPTFWSVAQVAEPPGCDPCRLDFLGRLAAVDIQEDHGIAASHLTHIEMHLVQTIA